MKMMSTLSGERISIYISKEEKRRLSKLRNWREENLVIHLGVNIGMPLLFLGLLAFVIPYVYMVVPVYHTSVCWA